MRVTIAGVIDYEPESCPRILLEAEPHIMAARAEEGCITYNWAFDPLVPGRIHVFEDWATEEALHAHFKHPSYIAMGEHLRKFKLLGFNVTLYSVGAAQPVYDESNKPRQVFFEGLLPGR